MALNYSSKHDISYANYNNKNIPWQLNASIISQNNQTINPSLNLGAINNNLVIESSQNDILFITSQNSNKKVIVKNNMAINNLDVSNNLKTKLIDASSISLNNILYFPSLPINIIGDLKVYGAITVIGSSSTGLQESKTQFINSILRKSKFTDVSIVECDISDSSFNNVNIINSYINAIPNGYGFDKSNNSYPNKANFSDVSLQRLVLDSSLNSYINFAANASNSIIIRSYDDYSKLKINKPLTIGIGETISNISNVSIFYGTISCNTLYYSQLVPDIRLNTYFDVSIGLVSVSGNNIPVNNSFNIGSSNYKFNEIISTHFIGDLSGTATIANDLRKNLDMSFNNLDIYGTFTLNRKNLNQFLSGDLISIIAADVSFIATNNRVRDLSASLYSKTGFDLCLNSNFTKISLRDTSFDALNNKITSISASVYSKSDFDLCLNLNRNYIRNNDVSAIASIVSNPPLIYPGLFYLNSSLNKVTDAKVTNELVFPYAITYVDDAYEDNILKEDYSYQIRVSGVRSFELNATNQTWEWHRLNATGAPGRSLADILNSTENEQIRAMVSRDTWTAGKRKVNVFSQDRTSATWEWSTGSQWSYTNWDDPEPGGHEDRVKIHQNGRWHDYDNGSAGPAVYVTVTGGRTDTYNVTKPKLPIIVASSNGSVVATGTSVQSGPNNAINNTASNAGYLKISENNINNSYYRTINTQTLHADSCSLAMSNDGMFIAYTQGSSAGYPVLKVNMRNSDGWGQQLGTTILLTDSYGNYQNMASGIIPTIFGGDWEKNIQNLAINYISGENPPRIFLAFGSARSKVSIYSYDNANWIFSNGFYSVTGGSWVLKHTHLASTLGASTNFGYFVVLSHNPRILVFTIDDKFYSYNCSDSSFAARGSNTFIRLPTGVTNFTNIIALKITSDADKIIVSNTHYVYIYKWNNASWTQVTALTVVPLPQPFTVLQGTGGTITTTITTSDGYIIHSFTNVGTSTFVPASSGSVEVLIVGGGGGGGPDLGGGGGGGGVIWIPSVDVSANRNYSIVVGAGGASATNGQNSRAFGAIGAGGGAGGQWPEGSGTDGGSGGGASANYSTINQGGRVSNVSTLGTNSGFIYGNRGGNMTNSRQGDGNRAAGGGGAGGQGLDTNTNTTGNTGQTGMGSGGVGVVNAILGPSHYWGGGGGGAGWSNQFGGWGGLGGGGGGASFDGSGTGGGSALNSGAGGANTRGGTGGAGGANTGGGGGGGTYPHGQGGTGGSGIVVIRYLQTSNLAGPRSLDISNINSSNNDCVFAIGFPDKLINSRANNRSRGYVEYYQCLTSSPSAIITKLATLVPRKRDINNNNVDTNEYFFSAGGIKITNANTILVSPNFKFHFNNTTKNYQYNSSTQSWTAHNTDATSVTGRTMASIENEVENELVKITGRGSNFYIGGIGAATQTGNRRGSLNWRWSNNDIFNYENWESYDNLVLEAWDRPYNVANHWIEFYGSLGTWHNTASNQQAMYMTRSLSYSLNTFNVFDRFYFHSSGFFSSYFPTDVSNRVIARWATTDTPLNRSIEIRANGQMFSMSYGSISDIRLKENIVDASPKLEDLLKVRVVNYNLKGCKDVKLIGVVAQELEQIFPALVKDGELSQHDIYLRKTESYKSVKYSCFDVILIKAFQEQMAIINTLSSQLDEQEKKCKLLKTISQDCVILKQELDLLKRENELFKLNINEILKLMTKC